MKSFLSPVSILHTGDLANFGFAKRKQTQCTNKCTLPPLDVFITIITIRNRNKGEKSSSNSVAMKSAHDRERSYKNPYNELMKSYQGVWDREVFSARKTENDES